MFGILITSAVYTWHFVYLTVLFFFFYVIFFYGGYNGLNGPQPLTRGSETWRREEGGELPPTCRQTDNLNSPVCMRREVCDEDIDLSSFPLPSLDECGGGGVVMCGRGGEVSFLFSDFASDDPGGPAPPTPPADEG